MEITEKIAYLKGLLEGMELSDKKEGKLFSAIIDVLDDMALELEDMQDFEEELADGLDAVSDDLEDVEDVIFDDEDDDDEDDDEDEEEYDFDELDEDEDCYATTCPTCEEEIFFDESILEDGEVVCPNCGEKLEFDLGSLDEDIAEPETDDEE